MKKLKITVEADDEVFTDSKEDIRDRKAFEKSIANYIDRFNALPPVGTRIANGFCDAGAIEQIDFNGYHGSVYVFLSFK